MGQLNRRTPSSRGLLQPFDLHLPGAPLPRREPLPIPSGAVVFSSLAVASSYRLAAFLGRAGKMPRIRFYNRRFTSRAPEKTSLSETARRALWETRQRSSSRPSSEHLARTRALLNGAGPPCGHPASNGCALDGANAGFGPFDTPCSRHGLSDESAQSPITKVTLRHRASVPRGASHAEVGEAPRLFRPKAPLSIRTL